MNPELLRKSLKLAVAAFLTAAIAVFFQRIEFVWYPLLAVVVVVDDNDEKTVAAARARILGTVTGGLVTFWVQTILSGWIGVLVSILLMVPVLRLLGWQAGLSTAALVSVMFLMIPGHAELNWNYVFNRALDTSVGPNDLAGHGLSGLRQLAEGAAETGQHPQTRFDGLRQGHPSAAETHRGLAVVSLCLGQAGPVPGELLAQPLLHRRRIGWGAHLEARAHQGDLAGQQAPAAGHQSGIDDPGFSPQRSGALLQRKAAEPLWQQGHRRPAAACRGQPPVVELEHAGPAAAQPPIELRRQVAAAGAAGQHQWALVAQCSEVVRSLQQAGVTHDARALQGCRDQGSKALRVHLPGRQRQAAAAQLQPAPPQTQGAMPALQLLPGSGGWAWGQQSVAQGCGGLRPQALINQDHILSPIGKLEGQQAAGQASPNDRDQTSRLNERIT